LRIAFAVPVNSIEFFSIPLIELVRELSEEEIFRRWAELELELDVKFLSFNE